MSIIFGALVGGLIGTAIKWITDASPNGYRPFAGWWGVAIIAWCAMAGAALVWL